MLKRLEFRGLRNLADEVIDVGDRLTLVEGGNAQGKSSLLEAAYLLATTKSFRTRDATEAIEHGGREAFVQGLIAGPSNDDLVIGMSLARGHGGKRFFVGQSTAKLPEYLGLLPALALSGDSLRQLVGSPGERRRFVDRAVSAAHPEHIPQLAEYRRALNQRNRLLKTEAADELLEPWEIILARVGESLVRRRDKYIASWQAEMSSFPSVFPEGECTRLTYRESTREPLASALAAGRSEDRRIGSTRCGPHRDDLQIVTEEKDLLVYGSTGQRRSALVALTLAQSREIRRAHHGRAPLLLLDDVDTDLDPARLAGLLDAASAEAQVLAATSKPDVGRNNEIRDLGGARYEVEQGRVSEPRS